MASLLTAPGSAERLTFIPSSLNYLVHIVLQAASKRSKISFDLLAYLQHHYHLVSPVSSLPSSSSRLEIRMVLLFLVLVPVVRNTC
ncbi:hypothetical protein BT69DRAFT_680375 [Atractiella rhizophila]|nr:hypothetical protein BT69DRAFT_680375 [Atractiella rhizophila]